MSEPITPACECGALEHPDEPHDWALETAILDAVEGCDCCAEVSSDGVVLHDGTCELSCRERERLRLAGFEHHPFATFGSRWTPMAWIGSSP